MQRACGGVQRSGNSIPFEEQSQPFHVPEMFGFAVGDGTPHPFTRGGIISERGGGYFSELGGDIISESESGLPRNLQIRARQAILLSTDGCRTPER